MKVVIIGAGVAGLGIGWRLAQAGAEVTVLERSRPGSGATWASAGMIALMAETGNGRGAEFAFVNYSNGLWPDFATELEQVSGVGIGYRRSGALMAARDAAALTALQSRLVPGLALVTAVEARTIAPMLTGELAGALWSAEEAHVDNRALAQALALAFQRAGGKLLTNEAVVRIEYAGSHAVAVQTPFAYYAGEAIVIAAGAWSGQVAPLRVVPVKGEMIALAPPADVIPPIPVVWGEGFYAVPRGKLLLLGATVEEVGFDTHLTRQAVVQLRRAAEAAMPSLAGWSLVDHWAGLRPRAPDGLPLLGATEVPNLFVAGGQYRNGILFAPAVAKAMAGLILGEGTVDPAFDPRRFKGPAP